MSSKAGWLQCTSVAKGMFSDELAVVVSRSNGATESYFVPEGDVEKERSRVRVAFHDVGSLRWATLPTAEPVTIPVNKADIDPR